MDGHQVAPYLSSSRCRICFGRFTINGRRSSFCTTGRFKTKTSNSRQFPSSWLQQIMNLQPVTVIIWGSGLVWLLHNPLAKSWRWLGLTYLFFLAGMMALHAEGLLRRSHLSHPLRRWRRRVGDTHTPTRKAVTEEPHLRLPYSRDCADRRRYSGDAIGDPPDAARCMVALHKGNASV